MFNRSSGSRASKAVCITSLAATLNAVKGFSANHFLALVSSRVLWPPVVTAGLDYSLYAQQLSIQRLGLYISLQVLCKEALSLTLFTESFQV